MLIVTLTTDYGDGPYAGALRGAVLSVDPDARLVDITHGVPPQDVVAGALALLTAVPAFPEDCVHVAVVDPGVGGTRRALAIATDHGVLIGPDNGVLMPVARALGLRSVHALTDPAYWRPEVSATFHGRDVFAPVAGHASRGVPFDRFGPRIDDPVDLDFGAAAIDGSRIDGRVLYVDPFGNAITNVTAADAAVAGLAPGQPVAVAHGGRQFELVFARTYSDVPEREGALLIGSAGFVEVAVNGGHAGRAFGLAPTDDVVIRCG